MAFHICYFQLYCTLQVVLEAGDALYNPQLWWHQVRSYDSPNIGISLWFSQFTTDYNDSIEDTVSI
jgi:ribosomal protein L16 Arg81 hydroxylase